jgi:tetratricopeptide (TPR) repeat protein
MQHVDPRGHSFTTSSDEAADAFVSAHENFLNWKAAVLPGLKAALEADPDFGFAHAVTGLVLHGARNAGFAPMIAESIEAARASKLGMTEREKLYVRALEALSDGQLGAAVAAYETILAHHPTDLLAKRLAQMELFWLGEARWSAEISARIAPHWSSDMPGYGVFLSCRAFDFEETLEFEEAERLGREAVEIDPTDVWGAHAVAHVLIMQGRHNEGIAWLDGLKDNWADANQMALHLWWHRCLFHLERGEIDDTLSIYDNWVRNRDLPLLKAMPDLHIDMQNGASLLLRLELRGIDVGGRWNELAELTLERLEDHSNPFTSAHFAVILAATGRFEQAEALIASMRAFTIADQGTLGPRYSAAAIPAAEAAVAHRKKGHQRVVDLLMPVRHQLWQMGGSHAQRDLFFLLLVDSAKALGRTDLLAIVLDDVAWAGFADPASRVGYRDAAALI